MSPNFHGFVYKTWGLIFADFNFRGQQCPRKIILILFRKNGRMSGTTLLSLNRSTVRKENLRPKYLKRKGIKDTSSLTYKQTEDSWIKWLFRTKQWSVCISCFLLELWMLYHTTLFAIKQLVVYSEFNVDANILFNTETKTVTCMSNATTIAN